MVLPPSAAQRGGATPGTAHRTAARDVGAVTAHHRPPTDDLWDMVAADGGPRLRQNRQRWRPMSMITARGRRAYPAARSSLVTCGSWVGSTNHADSVGVVCSEAEGARS